MGSYLHFVGSLGDFLGFAFGFDIFIIFGFISCVFGLLTTYDTDELKFERLAYLGIRSV